MHNLHQEKSREISKKKCSGATKTLRLTIAVRVELELRLDLELKLKSKLKPSNVITVAISIIIIISASRNIQFITESVLPIPRATRSSSRTSSSERIHWPNWLLGLLPER
jgi:hypothetical protein